MSFLWSPEAVGLLQEFYVKQGLSAAQTAAALTRALRTGPTRNAVLGKAQRLGLNKPAVERPEPPPKRAPAKRGPIRRPRPLPDIALPPLREVQTGFAPKLWTDRLSGECAYPVGEPAAPGQQLCCAAPTGGPTYCAAHRSLMVLPKSALNPQDEAVLLSIARRAA